MDNIKANQTQKMDGLVLLSKIKDKSHPHSKPIELQKQLILATTSEGDYVLDPAAGGYSVLKACEKLKRIFIGCDLVFD